MVNFWKNKNVLVTGHTGFKGSWLAVMLNMFCAKVTGYALDPRTDDDNFTACGLSGRMIDIRGDIRDFDMLKSVFAEYKPEVVFHLAAQPLVLESYRDIRGTYDTNIMGTLNLLECVKGCPETKSAVIVTTDKCYENKEQIYAYRESDRLGGYDPYSSSKACAEILVSSYRDSFLNTKDYESHKKAVATARAGNVIGGGDWSPGRIVPDCIRSFFKDGKTAIRSPRATRPWQHVIEPLYGYLMLAEKLYSHGPQYSGAWNFGPDTSGVVNVWDLAGLIMDKLGGGELIDASSHTAPHEADSLSLDITKAVKYLGFNPVLSIGQAVEMTVSWYKLHNEGAGDVYGLCVNQIEDYLTKVCI
jgi:CDP-glucose 4,6-dehydratase